MAKVIEFYVPKNYSQPLMCAFQRQRGKVIEFLAKRSVPARPAGWVFGWPLVATESNRAVVSE